MIRCMCIVQYVSRSASWYLSHAVQIESGRAKYKRGDEIQYEGKRYAVIEDYGCLRVRSIDGPFNPFKPLISQLPIEE
ncbi:hypothetical protein M3N64_10120 [Sporolactobacillus sp. CPB3-1]|uniref:Uncharacterized protein n=1 Tax=Sporolactobacillus mangiferae TaxID=2940498 RepID=A0ABT0MCJ5_9BACL|nr:hypothetical protein [Sporolactobacillus mangiferae]MCL1632293.1 hypothetical protein [Sporolactobacillus mangiferae]